MTPLPRFSGREQLKTASWWLCQKRTRNRACAPERFCGGGPQVPRSRQCEDQPLPKYSEDTNEAGCALRGRVSTGGRHLLLTNTSYFVKYVWNRVGSMKGMRSAAS